MSAGHYFAGLAATLVTAFVAIGWIASLAVRMLDQDEQSFDDSWRGPE